MRRSLAITLASLTLATVSLPAQAGVGTFISVDEYAYLPDVKTAPQPTIPFYLVFQNEGSRSHTATQDAGLFDTGVILAGNQAQVGLLGSGTYPYHCTIHPARMQGEFRLRPTVSDAAVDAGDTVSLQIAVDGLKTPYAYDVQRRRNDGSWVLVRNDTTLSAPSFTLNRAGTYEFRARTGVAFTTDWSKWSPVRKVVVS